MHHVTSFQIISPFGPKVRRDSAGEWKHVTLSQTTSAHCCSCAQSSLSGAKKKWMKLEGSLGNCGIKSRGMFVKANSLYNGFGVVCQYHLQNEWFKIVCLLTCRNLHACFYLSYGIVKTPIRHFCWQRRCGDLYLLQDLRKTGGNLRRTEVHRSFEAPMATGDGPWWKCRGALWADVSGIGIE